MKRNQRATSNLRMLEFVARKLDELNNEVVYPRGCTTALFINDPLSLDVRPTLDVDCIIDVLSLGHYDDIILDLLPTDENVMGWGNFWYKEAIQHAVIHQIAEDISIKTVTSPYFLATKIEAFKSRENNDFLAITSRPC